MKLLKQQENQIGSAMANINSLKASGTWKYKAIALIDSSDEIAKYELSEITGW